MPNEAPRRVARDRANRDQRRRSSSLVVWGVVLTVIGSAIVVTGSTDRGAGCVASPDEVGLSLAYVPLFESDRQLARDLDAVRATGARWIRFDFSWAELEPRPGAYNWELTDRVIDAARARDLRVLALVTYSPTWARPAGTSDHAPPVDDRDYARFLEAAVRRYAPRGVHTWEIWNEPNNGHFWSPQPDAAAYASLLRRAYRAVHDVDPGATVVSGGLSPAGGTLDETSSDGVFVSPWRFASDVYEHGGRGIFDALGHHPYPPLPNGPATKGSGNPFQQSADLHRLMAEHGDGGKPIWATEAGSFTGTSPGAVSERRQARLVVELLALWDRWDFGGPFFYYSLRDLGDRADEREDNFGLVKHDYAPKAALAALEASVC